MSLNSAEALINVQHFIGVVENRNDPLNIGRCQVRVYGVHTEDKIDIPTGDLPWAMPVMPYNSASISGIGISPTGPVEGTWVFGMFIDGIELQQPIILGTLVGIPKEKIASNLGFGDPKGIYPKEKYLKQSDVNRLARGPMAEGEESLAVKNRDRVTEIPTAVPPITETVRKLDGPKVPTSDKHNAGNPGDFYYRNHWNEPFPRYGGQANNETCFLDDTSNGQIWEGRTGEKPPSQSAYPYNHTYTSESGHVMEYDDTPGSERIHQYHTKGSFYEIQPDGSRVTKIVGDDYEMFLKGKNVVVDGNMNLTVRGDVRLMVEKNLYQEVRGDYHLRVDGDMVTKIRGNEQKEIQSSKSTQINENRSLRVGGNEDSTIDGSTRQKFKGERYQVFSNNVSMTIKGFERHLITGGSFTMYTSGNTNFMTDSNFTVKTTSNVNIHTEDNLNLDATANVTIDTPKEFLVGTNVTPEHTFIKSDRIDLND
tara:strand:- start:10290 stop:11732 length:1443 start_codon:yes stop_codon:yes gene_type:complete